MTKAEHMDKEMVVFKDGHSLKKDQLLETGTRFPITEKTGDHHLFKGPAVISWSFFIPANK